MRHTGHPHFAYSPVHGTLLVNNMTSSELSGTKLWFETWLFFYHLTSGGNSSVFLPSVKDPFLGLPLVNYHLRKKNYINFILYFLLYCILLYLCLCKTSTILKSVNVGTMLQRKHNQLLHLISWTNQMGSEIYFLFFTIEILVEKCHLPLYFQNWLV